MTRLPPASPLERRIRGSVLIIVLWISLGLVALTLYFANSMSAAVKAADNRVAAAEAREAVNSGIRYAAHILSLYGLRGAVPDVLDYHAEALPVADGSFWFIGRNVNEPSPTEPYFALIDESSKLNLNTATRAQLELLPTMTTEVADAVYSWPRASAASSGGYDNTYSQLDPPRRNKGSSFETVDELRLVYGVTPAILFGEDANRNGVLDRNEDDGEQSAPRDNQDGQLLAGVSEYVTVYSRLPTTGASGQRRVNIRTEQSRTSGNLRNRLTSRGITEDRIGPIMQAIGTESFDSVMAFFLASRMTAEEFALVHTEFTAADGAQSGLVNVNTASEPVLAAINGIGADNASAILAYRATHLDSLTSFAWLRDVMRDQDLRRAGQYITDQSYRFTADVAAVGHNGRGYHRERVVFDTSAGVPRIVYRQDLSAHGWALGARAREQQVVPNQF